MRTKTILAAVAATMITAVGVTAPAIGSGANADNNMTVSPMGVGSTRVCC